MARRHILIPETLEALFVRLEELVLASSGEDAFEEIFKLLVAKLWDEKSGGAPRFSRAQSDDTTWEEVNALLAEAGHRWPGIIPTGEGIRLTPQHLATCVDVLARYDILDRGLEAFDAAFEFLMSRSAKGAKGQYFTPRHIVDFCVQMVDPSPTDIVLDPACGSGAFLVHTLNYLRDSGQVHEGNVAEYCRDHLWGVDYDGRAVRIAKALMLIVGDGSANIVRANSLLKPPSMESMFADGRGPDTETESMTPQVTLEDIIRSRIRSRKGVDIILTNPPFAGEIREPHILERYFLARGRKRIERDSLFLERCVELLRPGGKLAIVLPQNQFGGKPYADTRRWLLKQVVVVAVVGLGRSSFMPHTHQKTGILFARKRDGNEHTEPERIFFAINEREGKNQQGQLLLRDDAAAGGPINWRSVDHDLGEILGAFREFCETQDARW